MIQLQLPDNVNRLENDEVFHFSCHPGVDCFTECCRELELALTPYDVLRLKQEAKLDSSSFLERYVIQEREAEDAFPRLYLTMVDDGRASCVFVAKTGCTVYKGRPGACRSYPMGRAAMRKDNNTVEEFFVLLKEPHCHGFQEKEAQTTETYSAGQELLEYNTFNDKVAALLQHKMIRQGMKLTNEQTELFVLALYDLDRFRKQLDEGHLPKQEHYPANKTACMDDGKLLLFGINWLRGILFQR